VSIQARAQPTNVCTAVSANWPGPGGLGLGPHKTDDFMMGINFSKGSISPTWLASRSHSFRVTPDLPSLRKTRKKRWISHRDGGNPIMSRGQQWNIFGVVKGPRPWKLEQVKKFKLVFVKPNSILGSQQYYSAPGRSLLGASFRPLYSSFVWFVPLIKTKQVFLISTRAHPRS